MATSQADSPGHDTSTPKAAPFPGSRSTSGWSCHSEEVLVTWQARARTKYFPWALRGSSLLHVGGGPDVALRRSVGPYRTRAASPRGYRQSEPHAPAELGARAHHGRQPGTRRGQDLASGDTLIEDGDVIFGECERGGMGAPPPWRGRGEGRVIPGRAGWRSRCRCGRVGSLRWWRR